ncbi:Leu/Ile/Val-binding protein [subsurface metagenome]|nr:ABC transporter substrate-binding protein [Dehalococcoidia bacterium]
MRHKIVMVMLSVALIVGLALTGCIEPAVEEEAPEEIVIGVFEPMTGPYAAGGQMTKEGIDMAVEENPEVLGRPVKMVLVDNRSEKVEAANAVARLIDYEGAVVVVGTYGSACAIPGSEVANNAQIPYIGCSPTNPLVTVGKPYAFRVCFIDPYQGGAAAKFAIEQLGAENTVIIQDIASDYSVGLSKFYREAFIEVKGPDAILEVSNFATGDQDFTAQLTSAKTKNPDVIFIPCAAYGEAALMIRQGREMGIEVPFLGGDTWEAPEFLEVAGEAAEGTYYTTHFDPAAKTTAKAVAFCTAFEEKYGRPPSAFAALGYDAYCRAIDAIEEAGSTDGEAIREALAASKDWEAVTGMITFDENGDPLKAVIVRTIKNGEVQYVTSIRP